MEIVGYSANLATVLVSLGAIPDLCHRVANWWKHKATSTEAATVRVLVRDDNTGRTATIELSAVPSESLASLVQEALDSIDKPQPTP